MNGHALLDRLKRADLVAKTGRVQRILPTYVEADGPALSLGALCAISAGDQGAQSLLAEVVGVNGGGVILAPLERGLPIEPGARVTACQDVGLVAVGDALAGRALDALGRPIDGGPPIAGVAFEALDRAAPSPLERGAPARRLETGIRAIDCLLTLAQGQRVGVFAAAGVGKTSLMTQLAAQVDADRRVICLVGERGREAEELWRHGLSDAARAQSVLVVATSDEPAAMRARAGTYAVALADHWRRQGHHVLLVVDSVTRLAMALREIGLAAGEPPTVRAYTPGVFAAIPRLVERCGALRAGGATTAVFTVLSETDDIDDPVSEMMKSILDGHIILSRVLAEQGRYPAIDAPRSISRMAAALHDETQRAVAQDAVATLAAYDASRTLIESGLYVAGASAEIDRAIEKRPDLAQFLRQAPGERTVSELAWRRLAEILDQVA